MIAEETDISKELLDEIAEDSVLSYENGQKVLEVPNELIPFWTKRGENLYYKDGEFKINI